MTSQGDDVVGPFSPTPFSNDISLNDSAKVAAVQPHAHLDLLRLGGLGQGGSVHGRDGGCGNALNAFLVPERTRVGKRIQGMGQRSDEHADGTGFGRSGCPATALVKCPTIRGAGVDEQGVHGPVEEHDVPFGIQCVQRIEVPHHEKGRFNPSILGSERSRPGP